ncbi:NUDIX hydrolase [Mesorhizobium silamurunense]|uniref:NUDIX hydrolase n=1 Tax=Mesorhizobium silamurunense TaxID=499528 RepID=UPI00177DEAEC|nr:NUDIX domain-containing protein [Mesorhizobium silamurunense]
MKKRLVSSVIIFHPCDHDKALFIERLKYGRFMLPGGGIEPNESPHDVAIREVQEEIGIEIKLLAPQFQICGTADGATSIIMPIAVLNESIDEGQFALKHIDFIFVAQAQSTIVKPREALTKSAQWIPESDIEKINTFEMVRKLVSASLAAKPYFNVDAKG